MSLWPGLYPPPRETALLLQGGFYGFWGGGR